MKNWKDGAINKKFLASFSGGKDSSLALYKAMEQGEALGIIVMMEEGGERTRAHSLFKDVLNAQAKAIGLPLFTGAASWGNYEKEFVKILEMGKELGAEVVVTGDIDVPEHECWHERVTSSCGLGLSMPLWKRNRVEVVREFIDLGFITKVVTVNTSRGMNESDLGKILTHEYIDELQKRGVDPCGESGEFHTVVIDGPLFKEKLNVIEDGITTEGEYIYLKLAVI
ncbi:MAG: diphthine--ammonia ligase [Clostridium sp.]